MHPPRPTASGGRTRCQETRFIRVSLITRITWYLTKNQVDQIKKLAKDNQISRSALVRMIIREYLARQDDSKKE
ncbi:MAG: CopG family transcriptional regulator [Syntrophomonadales bacterium]